MRKLLINSDHDRTLCRDFATTVAIRFNSSLKPKVALDMLMAEPPAGGKIALPEHVVKDYLTHTGKRRLETLEDIAICGEWGLYDSGWLTKPQLVSIKASLLAGLREAELEMAKAEIPKLLTKGAISYAKSISGAKYVHTIISEGWEPLVQATANALRDMGASIAKVVANTPVFENGVFTGRLIKIDKASASAAAYASLGFRLDRKGGYKHAVMVDDSAENIPMMKQHGLAIAFCPTDRDSSAFKGTGIEVQTVRDLSLTFKRIEEFAANGK